MPAHCRGDALDLGQYTTEVARTAMRRNTSLWSGTCHSVQVRTWYLMSRRGIEIQRAILKAQPEQEQVARSVAGGSAVRMALSGRSVIDPTDGG